MGPLQVFVCKPYESIKAWKTCRDSEAGSHSFIETVCGFEAHQGSSHQEPFKTANLKNRFKTHKGLWGKCKAFYQAFSWKEKKIPFCKQGGTGFHSLKVFRCCFFENRYTALEMGSKQPL